MSIVPGKNFGHYKIISALGAGGMGEVHLAEDSRLERRVALKILPEQFVLKSDRLIRFVREAKAASALNHPNIITIYEIGESEGVNFIATEFIDGETLRSRLEKGKMPMSELLSVAVQTADALAAAHAAGIVHRDIKPENIMIRRDGYVKVLDFGLAKLTEQQDIAAESEAETRQLVQTVPGMILGTVRYMSPEQTRGLATIDARTDIWSLGVVIFEMLAGRPPFTGETSSDLIASILKTEAPYLSKITSECPHELDRIVAKTLRKDREERYQVIKDLALDLKCLRKDLEFSSEFERVTNGSKADQTAEIVKQPMIAEKGRRFFGFEILAPALLIVLAIGGFWWFSGGTVKQSDAIEIVALKTVEIVNWAGAPGEFYSVGSFSPDAKMIAFTSTKDGSPNVWIKQTASGEAVQITKDEFKNENPIWSPDGEELAYFSTRGAEAGIWRIPVLGGSPKIIAPLGNRGSFWLRLWSKNNLIYYESDGNLFAADANTGNTRQITDFDTKPVKPFSIFLSPDERSVAFITKEGKNWSVWTKSLDENAPAKIADAGTEIKNAVWHPDNQRVFYSAEIDGTFQIFVTDINTSLPKQLTFGERDSFVLDASKDGTKILYGSAKEESDIWRVNLNDSKESVIISEINSELWANVSPDGKTLVYQSIKNLSQGNKMFGATIFTKSLQSNDAPVRLVENGFLPVWSPDGRQISFMRLAGEKYRIEIVKAIGGESKQIAAEGISSPAFSVLPYNRIQTSEFSWSPDSSKLAYVSQQNGQVDVWQVNADGSNNSTLTDNNVSNHFLYCPIWSPDGGRVAFSSKQNVKEGKPDYGIWVVDTASKSMKTVIRQNSFLRLIGWSASGEELILAAPRFSPNIGLQPELRMLRVEIETGKTSEIAVLKETYLYNIHLSPDKKTIAFVAHRDGKDDLWTIPASGGEAKKVTANNDARLYFSSLAWSPDNNSIFFGKQSRYSLLSMLTNFK
jgi:serine/threonine protein kinase/Tol biopolymer transport system component